MPPDPVGGVVAKLTAAASAVLAQLGMGSRACRRRPRPTKPLNRPGCIRPHCDRCGGHNPILDEPGDFAVCQPCRDEMDIKRPA